MKRLFVSIIFAASICSCHSGAKIVDSGQSGIPGERNAGRDKCVTKESERADKLWEAKQFEQAISYLKKRKKQEPQKYTSILASFYCRQDQYEKALSVCDQYISQLEKTTEPGEVENLASLDKSEDSLPELINLHILRGRILCLAREFKKADTAYDAALVCCKRLNKVNPKLLKPQLVAKLLKDKTYCSAQLEDYKRAIKYLKRALKYESDGNSLTIKLCRYFKFVGMQDKHNYWKQVVIASEVHDGIIQPAKRALILRMIGDYEEAIEVLKTVEPQPSYSLAMTYEAMGRLREALEYYKSALQETKDRDRQFEILTRRARILAKLKDFKQAYADSDKACQIKPDSSEALKIRSRILKSLGKEDEAIRDFQEAVSLDKSSIDSRFLRLQEQFATL